MARYVLHFRPDTRVTLTAGDQEFWLELDYCDVATPKEILWAFNSSRGYIEGEGLKPQRLDPRWVGCHVRLKTPITYHVGRNGDLYPEFTLSVPTQTKPRYSPAGERP